MVEFLVDLGTLPPRGTALSTPATRASAPAGLAAAPLIATTGGSTGVAGTLPAREIAAAPAAAGLTA